VAGHRRGRAPAARGRAAARLTMRICIATREYPPVTDYFGGIGSQYGRLAPALAALGHEVHVIVQAPELSPAPQELDGVRIHAIERPRLWPWFAWAYAGLVADRVRALGPFDAVLAPEFAAEGSRYAAAQDAGPLLTHLLTSSAQLMASRPGVTWRDRNGPRARVSMALERRQAARSAALSAPSDGVLSWARELWPEIQAIPTYALPLTIEFEAVTRAAAAGEPPPEFPRDTTTVTLPSRLEGHKGGQFLIEALRDVWEEGHEVELVFVGREGTWNGQPIREHLSGLAGERRSRVHFLGAQPAEQYMATVEASTIIAIPSLWESFCLAGVEALALRRPLVATSGHGFDAFARDGENALLTERKDVDGLRAALRWLLGDPALRDRLGTAGEATARGLDVAKVAPSYAEVLGRLGT
jgi:glycosyltransferase involved in cell wall biosynthesis